MKHQQKIALALALIGGAYKMNENNKIENRNGDHEQTPNDKILEILNNDKILSDKRLKKINRETNERLITIIERFGVEFTGNYKEDQELYTLFSKVPRLDLNYFNSVIRRSGIYLDIGIFAENLLNAITEINYDQRKSISEKGGIIDQIEYDFYTKKEIYKKLTEQDKVLKVELGAKVTEIDKVFRAEEILINFGDEILRDFELAEAIAKGLEKIGYYDQEDNQE